MPVNPKIMKMGGRHSMLCVCPHCGDMGKEERGQAKEQHCGSGFPGLCCF